MLFWRIIFILFWVFIFISLFVNYNPFYLYFKDKRKLLDIQLENEILKNKELKKENDDEDKAD